MRRISGHDNCFFGAHYHKEVLIKKKSPFGKSKSKGKITTSNPDSFIHPKNTRNRKNHSFHHNESNESSTHYTTNKSKKGKTKSKPKKPNLKKYEKQIMQVLNTSATIIQRQWRKYLIRKYRKSLRQNLQQQQKSQIKQQQFSFVQPPKHERDERSVSICTEQHSDVFNNQKYFSCHSLSSPKRQNENTLSKNIFSFNSSEKKLLQQPPLQSHNFQNQSASNYKAKGCIGHLRSSSDVADLRIKNDIQGSFSNSKVEKREMSLEKKTVNVWIEAEEKQRKQKQKKKKRKFEDEFIHGDKEVMEKVIKRFERKLEEKKLKQILSLQNSFTNNMMTFRSYEKTLHEIAEDHKTKLSLIKSKRDKILHNWEEILQLYEKSVTGQKEETMKAGIIPMNLSESDFSIDDISSNINTASIVFEEWEMESEKKQTKCSDQKQLWFSKNKKEEILIKEEKEDESDNKKNVLLECSQEQLVTEKCCQSNSIIQNLTGQICNYESELKTPERQTHGQKGTKEEQEEIKKFYPIHPNIQHVNSWLLQISHYVLDHHGQDLFQKLVHIEQPPPLQLLQQCLKPEPYSKDYQTISQTIFKEFEYFNIKNLIEQNFVKKEEKDTYSALIFTFHRCLVDCLNLMLLDELIYGRKWITYPWKNQFKIKKIIVTDHPKQCLERAINRVSTLADYELYPIEKNYKYGAEYEEIHRNLISLEEVKGIPLECEFERGFVLLKISGMVVEEIVMEQIGQIKKIFDASLIFFN